MRLECCFRKVLGVAQRDLKKVRTRARQVERARADLRDAIVRASETGESVRDIAPFADLSLAQVHNLLKEAKELRRPP